PHDAIPPHGPAGTVATVRSRTDIVRDYLAAFALGDPATIAGFVSPSFHNEHLSALGSGCAGREEYARRLPTFLADFVGVRYTVVEIGEVADSCDVVVRYRMEAEYGGTPIDIAGMMWFTVTDGLIDRRTDLWDSLSFLRQTGPSAG
ncbi:MAG: nuclear transport factor 2 family protein, partial [Ilumatobacteraceae bacterium]